jgi:hypothetical protein
MERQPFLMRFSNPWSTVKDFASTLISSVLLWIASPLVMSIVSQYINGSGWVWGSSSFFEGETMRFIVSAIVGMLWASTATAAIIIDTNFSEGSYAATGLFDFSQPRDPTIGATIGVGGGPGLDFVQDGASVSASRPIDSEIRFSLFAKFNGGNTSTVTGALSFGWTKAAANYNPYSGVNTTPAVLATDHVMLGLATTSTAQRFRFSAVNGTHGAMNAATQFGSAEVVLTNGNWYRLEGTILYNSTTSTFTFNDISLDDFGTTGLTEVAANILTGTGKTLTVSGFGSDGRVVYSTNRDRGFSITDNYFAESITAAVPEPSSFVWLSLAGGAFFVCRRKLAR